MDAVTWLSIEWLQGRIKYKPEVYREWSTQPETFTTKLIDNVEFTDLESSAKKIVTWGFNLDESTKGFYCIIIGRNLLKTLVIEIKFSDNNI